MFRKYKNLGKFKTYYRKYMRNIRTVAIVMITASTLGLLLPYFISRRLLGIADISYEMVITLSAIILSITLFHHIFVYLWEKIASVLNNNIAVDIRKEIISRFMETKYSELKNKTSGFYLERINDDVTEVSSFLSNILGISADCITNFSFLAIIYVLNYQCGIIFTAGITAMYLIEYAKIKVNLKYLEIIKGQSEKFNSKINENLKGIKDIKGLGIKEKVVYDTDAISRRIAEVQIKRDKRVALLSRCKTYTQHFVEAVLIVYAVGWLTPRQHISVIILLTIINYGGYMYDLVGYIANIKDWFVRGDYKASRILQILDNENMETFGDCDTIETFGVSVNALTYSYDSNDCVLDNVSFDIPEKSVTVFAGASGGGKTTLFGILSRLIPCDDGVVRIGNVDINSLSENCLRNNLSIVNQEPFLFNDTVLNNITIVKPDATLDEVHSVCRKAHIFKEISGFEDGFDTLVSENGGNLSGGQKQRISIARALLKNSRILLFDEPTSSLDRTNQELFFETVSELKAEKTILLIAHRLSDYSCFDNVYELSDGRLHKISR